MPQISRTVRTTRPAVAALLAMACITSTGPVAADWRGTLDGGVTIGDASDARRVRATLSEPSRPLTRTLGAEYIADPGRGDTFVLDGSLRYWLTRGAHGFIDTRLLRDEPLGIDRQWRVVAGPGYRWQRTPAGGLGIEAGAGVVSTRLDDGVSDGDESVGSIGLLRADGFRNVLDRLRLDARMELARTDRLTELRGEVSVALNLGGGTVRYTLQTRRVDPDRGAIRDETQGFVSIGYRF